jgi:glycosyltransferase involved in cell wall biosynthesis
MKINFVVFNSFGGGNKNLYLLHEEAIKRKIKSEYIILSNNKVKNKSYFLKIKIYFYSIIKCMFLFIKSRFSNNKNEFLIFSDPLICFISILIPKNKRVYYAQSDDFNLHIAEDGHPKVFILLHKFIVKINNIYNYKKVFANSLYIQKIYLKFHKEVKIIYPISDTASYLTNTNFNYKNRIQKKNKLRIGTIGRKHTRKGLKDFLFISEKLKKSFEFVILSQEIDENYSYVKIYNPKTRHEFFKLFSKFDIFISTSSFEGFGLPILESLNLGIPVIAKDNGSINDLLYKDSVKVYNSLNKLNKTLNYLNKNRSILSNMQKYTIVNSKRFTQAKSFEIFYRSLRN